MEWAIAFKFENEQLKKMMAELNREYVLKIYILFYGSFHFLETMPF